MQSRKTQPNVSRGQAAMRSAAQAAVETLEGRALLSAVLLSDGVLTLSGDELIIRIGGYRRHILLPEALRGGAIKATREGEHLIVRQRV